MTIINLHDYKTAFESHFSELFGELIVEDEQEIYDTNFFDLLKKEIATLKDGESIKVGQ